MTQLKTIMCGAAIVALSATPALAGQVMADKSMDDTVMKMTETSQTMVQTPDFASYDKNADGRVDFKEYSKWAVKDGMTVTAAAQKFTKMTSGQAWLDEGTFLTAMSYGDDYYNQPIYQPRTVVLSATTPSATVIDTNSNVVMDQPISSPDMSPSDWKTPVKEMEIEPDYTTTSTGLPSATVDPMYVPEDKVMGDLTQTVDPSMQVRPDTPLNDPSAMDAELDSVTPEE